MNPFDFATKWSGVELSERSACQQHFLDLCALVGHETPAEADPTGESFTFEKGTERLGGGRGWADVWKRGFFGWEYKKKRANLDSAYKQLLDYRESLENPPLLVVCDIDLIRVHTNFTGTPKQVHDLRLTELHLPSSQRTLRAVFHDPEVLRPGPGRQQVTEEAAQRIGDIAQRLRSRGEDPLAVAHFLDRLVFCMFAEDINLLPKGVFSGLLNKCQRDPARLKRQLGQLFQAMADGGDFGAEEISHFNGALFTDASVLDLTSEEISLVASAATLDWSAIDPSIFGTLFERGLDPQKRGQLGAHYTSREDIELLVDPVVLQPLRQEWKFVQDRALKTAEAGRKKQQAAGRSRSPVRKEASFIRNAAKVVQDFQHYLAQLKVLDPACGSGNFLFVTLQKLLDFEREIIRWTGQNGLGSLLPLVHPRQLYGIETNTYAFELAQMSVWIGYLQWIKANSLGGLADPILETLPNNFRNTDAIVARSIHGQPTEPPWPKVDFIVGNPPFLGGKFLRRDCGDEYVDDVFTVWNGRVARQADICCYWFEKARAQIESGACRRAGLLATQGIRGRANREVLQRIQRSGGIFFAESDRPWVLDGANVHISMVGFDDGTETARRLDGQLVQDIHANLTSASDTTAARPIAANAGRSFMGDTKGGAFDIPETLALEWLYEPNPHGEPNSSVLVPWVNGKDLTGRSRSMWIIDFGIGMSEEGSARFEKPFEYARERVQEGRESEESRSTVGAWWQHERARPEMRAACSTLQRYIATPRVAKYRLFVWLDMPTLADSALISFASDDDAMFGLLHSRPHELWAIAQGTQLREKESGARYTPSTCFETFPLPAMTPAFRRAITNAATDLDRLRNTYLAPPEWTKRGILKFPGTMRGPWSRLVDDADARGLGTVRYERIVPVDDKVRALLAARTLTKLYNQLPTWLTDAHRALDEAVFAAYGWPADLSDEQILRRLLELNRAQAMT